MQYAHYFRWRATDKLRIPQDKYRELVGSAEDGPFESHPLQPVHESIDVERSPVAMYGAYQSLLDGLAQSQGWAGHRLAVGEDLAYANMVACASARWTIRPDGDMPVMGPVRAGAIVDECLNKRQYFLRQMLQSLPAVVIVFSQTTADAFIAAMRGRFTLGNPQPQERIADLIQREIRLSFGRTQDGEELRARVIFSPHASSRPEEFEEQRAVIVAHLADEVAQGRLGLNAATGHLLRKRGGCQFCDNALYSIGPCDYRAELQPLAMAGPSALEAMGRPDALKERSEHERLLREFVASSNAGVAMEGGFEPLDAAAPSAPKLVLLGEVVTMTGPPIRQGAVYLERGVIVAVQERNAAPPEQFEAAPRIQTEGVIYPGLADLHNHLIYNIFTLWWPKVARSNRSQWLRDPDYRRLVSKPMATIAARQDLLRAAIRYVETKLILGGVTSGQGMHSRFHGTPNFRGLVRNFEQPADPALRSIGHKIPDLNAAGIDAFRAGIDSGDPYFFHLAEGTNDRARQQFTMLQDLGLVAPNLVGIHSLGLEPADLQALAAAQASVVWSPFSNSILYGRTIRSADLLGSGARFALGSDWTPSGSRNVLQEIKVAALTARHDGVDLPAERLVQAVTSDAMTIAGWGAKLGKIAPEYFADLLVLDRKLDDPYENLVAATEREVRLVLIAGHPRHGDKTLMLQAGLRAAQLEDIAVGGRAKALNLSHPSSPINNVGFASAKRALEGALADLHATRDAAVFEPLSSEGFVEVELDMQSPEPESGEFDVLAEVELPQSVPLDAPTVIDDDAYWAKLDSIAHLPAYLKGLSGLRRFYEGGM